MKKSYRIFSLLLIFIVLLAFDSPELCYATNNTSKIVEFKDKNLEKAVRQALEKGEGEITNKDMLKLAELHAYHANIKDLSGLEYAVNLRSAFLSGNQITNITPLMNLNNMKDLELSANHITDISSLSGLKNLEMLNLSVNQITDLSALTDHAHLKTLYIARNEIKDLTPINTLKSLINLSIANNRIEDITGLSITNQLDFLNISQNNIKDISVLKNVNHKMEMILYDNLISDISPLVELAEKGFLDKNTVLLFNELNTKDEESQSYQDIQKLQQLGINVHYDPQLPTIASDSASIYGFAHTSLPKKEITIVVYDSDNNKVTETKTNDEEAYIVEGLKSGEYRIKAFADGLLSREEVVEVKDGQRYPLYMYLAPISLKGEVMDKETGNPIKKYEVDIIGDNFVKTIYSGYNGTFSVLGITKGNYQLTIIAEGYQSESAQIEVTDSQSVEFSLAPINSTQTFDENTKLRLKIDDQLILFTENPYIINDTPMIPINELLVRLGFKVERKGFHYIATNEQVKIEYNVLSNRLKINGESIILENKMVYQNNTLMTPIEVLYQLKDFIGVELKPEIKTIEIYSTPFVTIKDATLEKIIRSWLFIEPAKKITAADMARIKYLHLTGEDINDLTGLEYAINLEELDGGQWKHEIDLSPLKQLNNLKIMYLSDSTIKNIDVLGDFTKLEELYLNHSGIEDISFLKNLENLKVLELSKNNLKDISPLKQLNHLNQLDLSFNFISNISSLAHLDELTSLDLENNKIADISVLKNLRALKKLDLSTNHLINISALSNMIGLELLSLENNQIQDISALTKLNNLMGLDISKNEITDITAISSLTKLTYINLSGNDIEDLSPLNNLVNLEALDIDVRIKDVTALPDHMEIDYYISNNNVSEIKRLLEQGVSPNTQSTIQHGKSILMEAVELGYIDIAEILIEAGADINQKNDWSGMSILDYAILGEYKELISLLLEKGVRIENELFTAAAMKDSLYVNQLLEYGAEVNKVSEGYHYTALMVASFYGNYENVKALLENGADPTIEDNQGNTALDYAKENENSKIIELLQKYLDKNN